MRLECRDCRFEIKDTNKSIKSCPRCGSANIEFITKFGESKPNKLGLFGSMTTSMQVRIVLGLIGIILMLVGAFSLNLRSPSMFGLSGAITLIIVGFILFAIATKGGVCLTC